MTIISVEKKARPIQLQLEMPIKFRLHQLQVTNLLFHAGSYNSEITQNITSEFGVNLGVSKGSDKAFAIIFDVKIENKEKEFKLELKATAHFSTDKEYDAEFINSDFIKINAPAIAFPYVRAFISNLTLNSGFQPLILPTLNFIQLAGEKSKTVGGRIKERPKRKTS